MVCWYIGHKDVFVAWLGDGANSAMLSCDHASFTLRPPFTIQRLCELILEPNKYYKSRGVFLRAVEKVCTCTRNTPCTRTHTCTHIPCTCMSPAHAHAHAHIYTCMHIQSRPMPSSNYMSTLLPTEPSGGKYSRTRPHMDEESKVMSMHIMCVCMPYGFLNH